MPRLGYLLIALFCLTAPLHAEEAGYDLIFRTGTLADQKEGATLRYGREIINAAHPEPGQRRRSEAVLLSIAADDKALLRAEIDGKHRPIGGFPASVGNPLAMYFMEATVRNLAAVTGGSPFYIRNRVKEALIKGTAVTQGIGRFDGADVATKIITMYPFRDGESRRLMGPFGALELRFTVSDAVPGWYLSLAAATPDQGDTTGAGRLYSDRIAAEPSK